MSPGRPLCCRVLRADLRDEQQVLADLNRLVADRAPAEDSLESAPAGMEGDSTGPIPAGDGFAAMRGLLNGLWLSIVLWLVVIAWCLA